MTDRLIVWLDNTETAVVSRHKDGIRLAYTDTARNRWRPGDPILSCSLPVSNRRHDATTFVDGLLPEGNHRRILAERADLKVSDLFGLIGRYGRDIAGAVQFLPEGTDPGDDDGDVEPLGLDALDGLVGELDENPLAIADDSELSLPGMQDKMLLIELGDGVWGRPLRGQPSTHILKRDHPRHRGVVAAELDALRLARHAGLTTIDATLEHHAGFDCLIVSRFDRTVTDGNVTGRIHQEDAVQALGRPATQKYEMRHGGGGPEFSDVAELLDRYAIDPIKQLDALAALAAFTAIIGNADAHGKNIAFLLDNGNIELAPAYDPVPTFLFPQLKTDAAMSIGGTFTLDGVDRGTIEREARLWRHSADTAGVAAGRVAEALCDAVAAEVIDPDGPLARRVVAASERFRT